MGMDLTYTCLGGDTMFVQLAFYRDCAGVAAPNNPTIDVYSNSCGLNFTATLMLASSQELNAVCASFTTTCTGGSYPGVEEYIYTGIVVLPDTCNDWTFGYALCCRNNAINTLQNTNVDIYVEASTNNIIAPCNNSPVFTSVPVPFVCVGVPYCFNNGAVDPDGDSLSYTLVTPTTGPNPGDTVAYLAGFSATNPVTSVPPLTIDPITGDICITPTQLEVTVLQVRLEEWRNGVLIGYVDRDIQIRVIACTVPNVLPVVDGINGTGVFSATICAGDTFCFFTNSVDPDTIQNVTMSWNAGIPNATFNISGGNRPVGTFCWLPDSTDISTTPHCFTVTVVDDNCPFLGIQTFSFCITVNGFMNTSMVSTNIDCNGNCNGQAMVSVSSGVPPFTYIWDDPSSQTTPNATGLCAGTYSVTVTDSVGCTPSRIVTITEPPALLVVGDSTAVTCNGAGDGTATATTSGGTTPYSYQWNAAAGSQTTQTATGLGGGTYQVSVTDDNGCNDVINVTVIEPGAMTATIGVTSAVSCFGFVDGEATVTPSAGTTPYTYQWDAATGNQTDSTATGLGSGTYFVTVTDNSGCTVISSIVVTEPSAINLSLTASNISVSCAGLTDGQITVQASGGVPTYTYNWSTGGTDSTATGLAAGFYSVTVTDATGCTVDTGAVITEPNSLVLTVIGTTNASCFGSNNGTATVSVTGGTPTYTYAWQSGGIDSLETGLAAGTYGITVTDINNCTAATFVVITEPSQIASAIATSTDASCFGGSDGTASSSISGGTTPYTYLWDASTGFQSTPTATGLAAGTYWLTITDDNGCIDSVSAVINEPPALLVTITSVDDVPCFGNNNGSATANGSGGISPYTYQWDANAAFQTTPQATGLPAGNYTVTLTDANGCTATTSATVSQPAAILSVTPNPIVNVTCFGGNDGSATAAAVGGVTPYSYQWGPGTGNQLAQTATGLTAGTYGLTVTDGNGCTATAVAVLTQPATATILTMSSTNTTCNNDSTGTANVSAAGGTGPYLFQWDAGAFFQTDSMATGLPFGTYTVTVTDANGCQSSSSAAVSQPTPITITPSPDDTICPGGTTLISVSATGSNGSFTYAWTPALGPNPGYPVSPTVNTTYTVTVTDALGCFDTASIFIFIRDLPTDSLSVTSTGDICVGGSTTIFGQYQGTGNYTFSWNQGLGTGLGPFNVSPTSTTDYIMSVTDVCGTIISDTVTVTVHPFPTINLPPVIAQGCPPLPVTFMDTTGNPPTVTYLWQFGENGNSSIAPQPTYVYNNPGTYIVDLTITSPGGCITDSSGTATVIVFDDPLAGIDGQPPVVDMDDPTVDFIDLSSNDVVSWAWSFGDGGTSTSQNPSHTYSDTGTYVVTLLVTNSNGCVDTAYFTVVVDPTFNVVIPNAFTPNPGGPNGGAYDKNQISNDVFFPFTDFVEEFHMLIFNRWGEVVFETKDIDIGWDGYYRGKLCQQDVYVYKINLTYTTGEKATKVGDVTLFR